MRKLLLALSVALCTLPAAQAQVSVSIGINLPAYPNLVQVPGYPVYYDPRLNSNYFFYDGLYWVYLSDNWYASSWYNGPWRVVGPAYVPLFVLRVPVRYYRQPPTYFHGWRPDAPPHWGEHWGREWEQRRGGWDKWDHRAAPAPAPLPVYQRNYSGSRYPSAEEQQHSIRSEKYRYQPKEEVAQQHFQQQGKPGDTRAEPRQQPVQQRAPARQQPSPQSQQRPQAQAVQMPTQTHPQSASKNKEQDSTRAGPDQRQAAQPQAPAQQHQAKPALTPSQAPSQSEPQNKGREKKGESHGKDQGGKN